MNAAFQYGDRVLLLDSKQRRYMFVLAENGFFHSFFFTTGLYPDNIEITKLDHKVTEAQCRRCHESITSAIDGNVAHGKAEGLMCTRCHTSVGHSESAAALKFPVVALTKQPATASGDRKPLLRLSGPA